jgi:hypothetical protein
LDILYSDQVERDSKIEEVVVGSLPFILLGYMTYQVGTEVFQILSWGARLILIVAFPMLLIGLEVIDPEQNMVSNDKIDRNDDMHVEKNDIAVLKATKLALPFITLLPGKKLLLGRSRKTNIKIDNAYVSGQHLLLKAVGDEVMVKDLGSTNGTYIDG